MQTIIIKKNSSRCIYATNIYEKTHYVIEPGADVTFLYSSDNAHTHEHEITFTLHENAQLKYHALITESVNKKLNIILEGAKAHAQVTGLYVLDEQQKTSITTTQQHHVNNATSALIINGALAGDARFFYDGNIFVGLDGKDSCALQENKTLLMSNNARAQSIPGLEVLTNDVQCQHGSAVSQVNDEHLYYLQSRGLTEIQARLVLLQSFFDTIIHSFSDNVFQEMVKKAIKDKVNVW